MKVIVLTATENRGKTTSINKAVDIIINIHGFAMRHQECSPAEDKRTVVAKNNKSIAFCSGGDDRDTVLKNISFAQKHKCDVLVSASRAKGQTYDEITSFMRGNGNSGLLVKPIDFWIDNNILADNPNDHASLSELTAEHLVKITIYALNK